MSLWLRFHINSCPFGEMRFLISCPSIFSVLVFSNCIILATHLENLCLYIWSRQSTSFETHSGSGYRLQIQRLVLKYVCPTNQAEGEFQLPSENAAEIKKRNWKYYLFASNFIRGISQLCNNCLTDFS